MNNTAIILCSYNMPEYADALVEHIQETVKMPYDLYFVDNGSDLVPPSKYTTYHIEKNIQMIPGFVKGFELAKSSGKDYSYYWMVTTSCRFDTSDKRDPLEILLKLFDDARVFAVQPSLIIDEGAWKRILSPDWTDGQPRKIYGLENVCPIFRASYYDVLDGLNEKLTYGFGVGGELYWKARKYGLFCYTHDGYVMYKDTAIGYKKDRMKMTYSERCELAGEECREILVPDYGENYNERFNNEYVTDDMWTQDRAHRERMKNERL